MRMLRHNAGGGWETTLSVGVALYSFRGLRAGEFWYYILRILHTHTAV